MPTTLSALVMLVFALVPGLPGSKIYQIMVGRDWREDNWDKALKLIAFSLCGLALYSVLALGLGAPAPGYLTITSLNKSLESADGNFNLFLALLGHIAGSGISGFVAGRAFLTLAKKFRFVPHSTIWDFFIRDCVPDRWVLVALTDGDAIAGKLVTAETSVRTEDRDVILAEPAKYSAAAGGYVVLPYQHLYLPSSLMSSITTLADPILDNRLTSVGDVIFKGEQK